MFVTEIISSLKSSLEVNSIKDSLLHAELIVMKTLDCDRAFLYGRYYDLLKPEQIESIDIDLKRVTSGEPWAYICGYKEFYGLNIMVAEGVFIPRPETELIVETVLHLRYKYTNPRIVEPCVGSGAISIALAKYMPEAKFEATDVSTISLDFARRNADIHGVSKHIRYKQANLLNGIRRGIDIIISNPPYIETSILHTLDKEIHFEPSVALDGGCNGIEVITQLLLQSQHKINKPGHIIFEITPQQTHEVVKLSQKLFPYAQINVHKDLASLDRVISIEIQ